MPPNLSKKSAVIPAIAVFLVCALGFFSYFTKAHTPKLALQRLFLLSSTGATTGTSLSTLSSSSTDVGSVTSTNPTGGTQSEAVTVTYSIGATTVCDDPNAPKQLVTFSSDHPDGILSILVYGASSGGTTGAGTQVALGQAIALPVSTTNYYVKVTPTNGYLLSPNSVSMFQLTGSCAGATKPASHVINISATGISNLPPSITVTDGGTVTLPYSINSGYSSPVFSITPSTSGQLSFTSSAITIGGVVGDLTLIASAQQTAIYRVYVTASGTCVALPTTGANAYSVQQGQSATLKFTLASGCQKPVISGATGATLDSSGTFFTIPNVQQNYTNVVISASPITHVVSLGVGDGTSAYFAGANTTTGSSVAPGTTARSLTVNDGTKLIINAALASGYSALVISDGGNGGVQSGSTFTTAPIKSDVTITTSATKNVTAHKITMHVGTGATLTSIPPQTVNDGDTLTLSATPLSGFDNLTISAANGTQQGNTFSAKVTSDLDVYVTATPVPPFDVNSYANYPQDKNIDPTITQNNSPVYTVSGVVTLGVAMPGGKAVMLIGNAGGWISSETRSSDSGTLAQVAGTAQWQANFDSTVRADGDYVLGAAYYVAGQGWHITDTLPFSIKNKKVVPLPVPPVATNTATTVPSFTLPAITPVPQSADFTPTLRVVVNNQPITDVGHVFDSEQVELRITALPPQYVQFMAYSVDGAMKPAIKELGRGGRDEILSRDGKDVWTFITTMSDLPTGGYRLFGRVHATDGTVLETAPFSITVQHLNGLTNTQPLPVATSDQAFSSASPAEARAEILARVHDPSDCQNREECKIFCSSDASAAAKCLQFAAVNAVAVADITSTVAVESKQLQVQAQQQFAGDISSMLARAAAPITVATSSSASTTPIAPSTPVLAPMDTTWIAPASIGKPSLVDVMPQQVIDTVVANTQGAGAALPAEVQTGTDLQYYCSTSEHAKDCTNIVTKIAPELAPVVAQQQENIQKLEAQDAQVLEQRTGARIFVDSSGDGISDYDKINIYHIDPKKKNNFGSDYSDGAALLAQTNLGDVLGTSTSSTTRDGRIGLGLHLSVENPKLTGVTQPKLLAVANVQATEITTDAKGKKDIAKTTFSGKALPNAFVKVYLFSDPVVVTVKTDDQGNWSYVLDKTIPDGSHTAYVAVVDGGGRIMAKSQPLPFVKQASAITVESAPDLGSAPGKPSFFGGLSPFAMLAIVVGVLGLGLSAIGVVIGMRQMDRPKDGPNVPTLTV